MRDIFEKMTDGRLPALFLKELRQIARNRRLVASLIVPPTLLILLFGFALNPEVKNIRLGVVDESRTAESRKLILAFTESNTFQIKGYYASTDGLGRALDAGELNAGLVVPYDYVRLLARHQTADIQLLVDAVDSNTAQIAGGYAARIVGTFNQRLAEQPAPLALNISLGAARPPAGGAQAYIALFYNPGLRNDWFIVTGVLGMLLILNGSLVAAATMVKEKEAGTVEQLLMTPAGGTEIIAAKIAPLFLLLTFDIWLALGLGYFIFNVPIRGSLLLLVCAGLLCILAGIGIGTFLATFSRSQQQAQLMGFFSNPPLLLLSGALTPIEAMPEWLQPFTYLNPVRHFAIISRGVLLKGVGLDILYPYFLALTGFTILFVGVSVWRFRRQLG